MKSWHIAIIVVFGIIVIYYVYHAAHTAGNTTMPATRGPLTVTEARNPGSATGTANVTAVVPSRPRLVATAATAIGNVVAGINNKVAAIFVPIIYPSASPIDINNACRVLLYNLPQSNMNYNNFLQRYDAITAPITINIALVARTAGPAIFTGMLNQPWKPATDSPTFASDSAGLWQDMNKNYWPQINGLLQNMQINQAQDSFTTRALTLYNSANGNYNRYNFAMATAQLLHDCQQEIVNETIQQIETTMYAPYSSFNDKYTQTHHASPLDDTWEATKWQISDDKNLAQVSYLYHTSDGHIYFTDSNGLYMDNGLNRTGMTNISGTKVYKTVTYDIAGAAIKNFLSNWQASRQYVQQQASVSNLSKAIGFISFAAAAITGNYVGVAKYIIQS